MPGLIGGALQLSAVQGLLQAIFESDLDALVARGGRIGEVGRDGPPAQSARIQALRHRVDGGPGEQGILEEHARFSFHYGKKQPACHGPGRDGCPNPGRMGQPAAEKPIWYGKTERDGGRNCRGKNCLAGEKAAGRG
jgi:hypothetical protein